MREGSSTSPQCGKVVVAIDLGTTCVRSANSLHTLGDNRQTTELYYIKHEDKWKVQGWGLNSRSICHSEDDRQIDEIAHGVKVLPSGAFVTNFKLLLADSDIGRAISPITPSSLSVTDMLTDYLREYGKHILVNLQRGAGYDIPLEAIQWCITVPSIWDDNAKQQMKDCMVRAGLVRGPTNITGSLHPVILILESEAASVGIATSLNLKKGDKFLVADIGAGTTDVVVQEWLGDSSEVYKAKEVCKSVGGLCGSSLVDNNFLAFLSLKVGPWLTGYLERFPSFRLEVLQAWEPIKCNFGDSSDTSELQLTLQLPPRLVAAASEEGRKLNEELVLHRTDMEMIFNPVVEMIKELLDTQLSLVGNIKTMVLVGGFSRSPYLRTKIQAKFRNMTKIVLLPCLEDFVVNGALNMALKLGGPVSRISRTTYGLGLSLESEGVSPLEGPVNLAKETECGSQIFRIDVLEGECVQEDSRVDSVHIPLPLGQKTMKFTLYSSSEVYPRYTDEESVTKQWDFVIDISELAEASTKPEVGVSIFYGRSCLEVEAVASFGAHKQLPVNILVGARISNTTSTPSGFSTKTYGLGTSKTLEAYDPLEYRDNRMKLCKNRYEIFIPRGIQLDACVARTFSPMERNKNILKFTMYSTAAVFPRYTTDEVMKRDWGFEVDISKGSHLDGECEVSVRLYVTRSWIEVTAVALNFNHPNRDLMVSLSFESKKAWNALIFSAVDRPFLRACMGATTSRMNVEPGFYIHEFHQQQKFGQLSGQLKVVDYHYEGVADQVTLEWLERNMMYSPPSISVNNWEW